MFVNAATGVTDDAGKPGKVLPRMKPRLTVESDPRHRERGHAFDERGVEAHLGRERRIVLELRHVTGRDVAARGMQVPRQPLEPAVDAVRLRRSSLDLRDRRETGVPDGLCVVAAEAADQIAHSSIGDHGQMRRRVTRVDLPTAIPLEKRDCSPAVVS